jgi:predicted ATPase
LVGRERELGELRALLDEARLVTLSGPGGVGKTRLATVIAAEAAPPVWFVDLTALGEPELVPRAAAAALGLRELPGQTTAAALIAHLRPLAALVVLDNCEHLVAACAELVRSLLTACPYLRVLATSREPLGVGGEVVWSAPPLGLPDPQATADEVAASAAVRLFAARAAADRPGFAVDAGNAAAVASVCRRLDGMPLAIELAAARARVLAVEQIADRLG